MENGDRPAGPVFYLVTSLILVLDQLTKKWIVDSMFRGESREVLGSFFRLTYVHNDGAAFGLDLGGRWSFIVVTILVVAFILFYYTRSERTITARWALALILGGALGNLADRIRIGEVVDFLHLSLGGLSWPIFNIADIGVSVGVALLAIHLLRRDHSEHDSEESGDVHDGDTPDSPHHPAREERRAS
ncbi:MAG: lipoprotein signal peptidase [Gemmatimonadota bacterium]|nr:MAG: lipoprotein signal peptidase [Gemmatimonadota bacterium]